MAFSYLSNKSVQTYSCLLFLMIVLLALLLMDNIKETEKLNETQSKHLVCYYCLNDTDLTPELLDFKLCTHIIAGFLDIWPNNYSIAISQEKQGLLARFSTMATNNRKTLAMVTIGGAGGSDFGPMVSNHTTRKMFIRSLMAVLKEYKLDGVDLDWEWPVISGGTQEKVKFIQLLHEIRVEFERHKKRYVLSAAVGAVESIVTAAYYVSHIAENVDFVNVMTYDYHFYTTFYPVTDFNSPLYPEPRDIGGALENLNVNYSINLWLSLGMPAEKILLGLPFYGHSFRLRNPSNHNRLSPAAGFGFGDQGFVSYSQVCQFIHSSLFVSVNRSNSSHVPFAYDFNNWVSYDDTQSISEKVEYALSMNLGGVMIYSLNSDDFSGICPFGTKYPLLVETNSKLYESRAISKTV